MNVAGALFGASAVTALIGALLAVGLRNIFHNILGFALAMLGVAGVFLSLGADFLAIVFVLVYVGAVAIAMVYAVMLSHPLDLPQKPRSVSKILAAAAVAAFGALAVWRVLASVTWPPQQGNPDLSAARAGQRFVTDDGLACELISVLLVVAMMGAVMIARRTRATPEGR